MKFLVSLFVTSRNLLFGVFLLKKIITTSQKIAVNGTSLPVSILECFGKIFLMYLSKSLIFKKTLLHMNIFTNGF